jgi:acyl carrier protein
MMERLIKILSDYTESDVQITEDTDIMNDLGLSSFDIINLAGDVEDEFDIIIPDDDIPTLRTVGDVIAFIKNHSDK